MGAGFIGRVHMDIIGELGDAACVAGVFDPCEELAKTACEKNGAEKIYSTPEEMAKSSNIDAIIVASPNKTHAELALLALENKKHVIVEKPLALNATDAGRIVHAAKKTGATTMVPHQMRWTATAQKIRQLFDKGDLGDVYYTKTSWLRQCGIPGWGSWFTRFSESGGGPLIDIGVHMLDLSLYLMGGAKPVTVFGSTYAKFGPRQMATGSWGTPDWNGTYDVEDLAGAMIKLDNGATLVLEVSWGANACPEDSAPKISLFGSEGGAAMSIGKEEIKLTGMKFGSSFTIDNKPPATNARLDMIKHFVDCVAKGENTMSPVESGLVNNAVLDAIYESSKTGKSVDIDWSNY